jgi:signal recognition particle subunit SRP68
MTIPFVLFHSLTCSRCVNIAHSHVLIYNSKNALALVLRAQTLINAARNTLSSQPKSSNTEPLKLDVHKDLLDIASSTIQSQVHQYQGLVELQVLNEKTDTGKTGRGKSVPVIERLDEYSAGGVDLSNLVTYPPKLQPVPVKPLFFDLAWNYIDYPGRLPPSGADENRSDNSQITEEGKKPAKRGWFGFGRS